MGGKHMKKLRIRKGIVLSIVILFVSASIVSSGLSSETSETPNVTTAPLATTWKVDDEGDGDFSSIQEAINDANVQPDDTIEVYSGTYNEMVVVTKQLILQGIEEELGIGDDEGKPVVDGGGVGHVIEVARDGVSISSFVVQNGGKGGNINAGVYTMEHNDIIVSNCVIQDNLNGVYFRYSADNHQILNNVVTGNAKHGIQLRESANSVISGNTVEESVSYGIHLREGCTNTEVRRNIVTDSGTVGIYLFESSDNTFINNSITNNSGKGIRLETSSGNTFTRNSIIGHTEHGAYLWDESGNNLFYRNNFMDNDVHAYDPEANLNNRWNEEYGTWPNNIIGGNYWDDYWGDDINHGPEQDIEGSDGIGDRPYDIAIASQDEYPKMYADDPYPPVVNITKPKARFLYINDNVVMPLLLITRIIGDINVSVDAYDILSGIQKVEFYVGNDLKHNTSTPPYSWVWQGLPWLWRTLRVVAYDNAGNSNSTELTVWKIF
jgi:nitrous oxidase accessory protein